jgi:hypothetical protein
MQGWWSGPPRLAHSVLGPPLPLVPPTVSGCRPAGQRPGACARPVRPVQAPITLAVLFRAGSSCCAAGQIIHLDEKKRRRTALSYIMAAGRGRRWILTGPGAVSSHAAKGPAAAFGLQRSGEPVLAASLRAGAIGPARDTALLAHRGPAAAARAWLDGQGTVAVRTGPCPAGRGRHRRLPGTGNSRAPGADAERGDPARQARDDISSR